MSRVNKLIDNNQIYQLVHFGQPHRLFNPCISRKMSQIIEYKCVIVRAKSQSIGSVDAERARSPLAGQSLGHVVQSKQTMVSHIIKVREREARAPWGESCKLGRTTRSCARCRVSLLPSPIRRRARTHILSTRVRRAPPAP